MFIRFIILFRFLNLQLPLGSLLDNRTDRSGRVFYTSCEGYKRFMVGGGFLSLSKEAIVWMAQYLLYKIVSN